MDLVWEAASYRVPSPSSSFSSIAEATAGNDVSSFLNSREEAPSVEVHSKYWVRCLHLEANTTDDQLKKMFYPYGADEAFTVLECGRLVGYVGFGMEEMAKLGAEKMNDFIPCRQTQALVVSSVPLEDVLVARTKVCTKACAARSQPGKTFVAVLYSGASEKEVAVFIQNGTDTLTMVTEVAHEISRASRSILERIMMSLTELWTGWPSLQVFREGLLRQLLRLLLESTDRCRTQGVNCGTAVGNLFAMRILDGDPFQIASRLLQRGVGSVLHVDSICLIARVCNGLPFAVSKASFWALVGTLAEQSSANTEVRASLLNNLYSFTSVSAQTQLLPVVSPCFSTRVSPSSLSVDLFSTPHAAMGTLPRGIYPHTSPAAQTAAGVNTSLGLLSRAPLSRQARSRTVYVSHLPPSVMQSTLMNYLLLAGAVNKVRICEGNGHPTLFAFVEMESEAAAQATMRLNGVELMGAALRVQFARNAIQDDVPEDAVFDPSGRLLRPCQFGQSRLALKDCIVRMPTSR